MSLHTVRKSITIKAPPEAVWDAITNPEKTKRYFFNCEVFSDWKKGSSITFKGHLFLVMKIEMTGTIVKAEPGRLLKYTLVNSGKEDNEQSISTVTDELTYANGVTTLTITDDVGEEGDANKRYEKSRKGWDKVLKGLKKLVEEEEQQVATDRKSAA